MRLYRCISAREITSVFKGNNNYDALIKGNNTHNYQKGIDYVHFFRFSKDAEIYAKKPITSINSLDHYIAFMVVNIPYEIIKPYFGYGIYSCDIPNMDYMPVPEYAIPKELVKSDYIVSINKYISNEYKNDSEFDKYIEYLIEEFDRYEEDGEKLAYHLLSYDFDTIINASIDDRSEQQIVDDKIKKLSRILKDEKF